MGPEKEVAEGESSLMRSWSAGEELRLVGQRDKKEGGGSLRLDKELVTSSHRRPGLDRNCDCWRMRLGQGTRCSMK